jgi:hypothetical protein
MKNACMCIPWLVHFCYFLSCMCRTHVNICFWCYLCERIVDSPRNKVWFTVQFNHIAKVVSSKVKRNCQTGERSVYYTYPGEKILLLCSISQEKVIFFLNFLPSWSWKVQWFFTFINLFRVLHGTCALWAPHLFLIILN